MTTTAVPTTAPPATETDEPTEAHYVRKGEILEGTIEGTPVTALCGAVFVPTRNPEHLPVCRRCEEFLSVLRSMREGTDA